MENRKRPSPWDQRPSLSEPTNVPSSSSTGASNEAHTKKRFIPENAQALEGMTKAELQAALKLPNQSMKELREISKKLEKFPPLNRESEVDPFANAEELVMKKYNGQPQVFACYRCDHTKTSNVKAKWRNDKNICSSCYDHLTRCVIPYRELPDHQRPKQCVHKVHKSVLKEYR